MTLMFILIGFKGLNGAYRVLVKLIFLLYTDCVNTDIMANIRSDALKPKTNGWNENGLECLVFLLPVINSWF